MTATTGTRCTLTYILYVYYIYIPSIALVRPASDLNLDEINVLSDKVNFVESNDRLISRGHTRQ